MTTASCSDAIPGRHAFSLNLRRQAIFSVPDAADVRIACVEGSVWITLDNDPRDVLLDALDDLLLVVEGDVGRDGPRQPHRLHALFFGHGSPDR